MIDFPINFMTLYEYQYFIGSISRGYSCHVINMQKIRGWTWCWPEVTWLVLRSIFSTSIETNQWYFAININLFRFWKFPWCTMVGCSAVGCSNQCKKNNGLSFFFVFRRITSSGGKPGYITAAVGISSQVQAIGFAQHTSHRNVTTEIR